MKVFQRLGGKLTTGIAGLLAVGIAAGAGAQAPTPLKQADGSYSLNANVDTVGFGNVSELVAPGSLSPSNPNTTEIDDEVFVTFVLPNIGAGNQFSNADFSIFKVARYNDTAFSQPGFNGNLLFTAGQQINQGETDDNKTYNIASPTINSYEAAVEGATYTLVEHNFILPTGNGNNNYAYNSAGPGPDHGGYISISSSDPSNSSGAQQTLTDLLNGAYQKYGAGSTVSFTIASDFTKNPDGNASEAYTFLAKGNAAGASNPGVAEKLSYAVVPAPEPGALTTVGLGVLALGSLAARRSRRFSSDIA